MLKRACVLLISSQASRWFWVESILQCFAKFHPIRCPIPCINRQPVEVGTEVKDEEQQWKDCHVAYWILKSSSEPSVYKVLQYLYSNISNTVSMYVTSYNFHFPWHVLVLYLYEICPSCSRSTATGWSLTPQSWSPPASVHRIQRFLELAVTSSI